MEGTRELESNDIETGETEEPTIQQEVPQQTEEINPNETTRETTTRIFKELSEAKGDGGEGQAGETGTKTEATKDSNSVKEQKESLPEDIDIDLLPPERISGRAKAMFNNLPKGLKREFNKAIKDVEAGGSRIVQEANKVITENKVIYDTVIPFAPKWAERGFSVSAGIASLCAAEEKLTNPKTSLEAYLQLGADLGHLNHLPEEIQKYAQKVQAEPQIQDPRYQALQENQNRIISMLEQQQLSPVVSEMNAVRQEVDEATGRPKYPELLDDEYFLSLKTRVSEIVGHDPRTSYGEALRQAAEERRQNWFGYSNSTNQARLPTANNQITKRAVNAAVSVRGKVGSPTLGTSQAEAPKEALVNPRATARWAFDQIKNGRA